MSALRMFSHPSLAQSEPLRGHVTEKNQVYAGRFFLYRDGDRFVWSVDGNIIALEETDTMKTVREAVECVLGKKR